jgi:hypothetical protein
MAVPDGTIGARLAARDAERFVGRSRELEVLEGLLVDDPQRNVVLVHGAGGMGKSALLREAARRAERKGWATLIVEAADLPHGPDVLETMVAPIRDQPRALLVLDSWEGAEPLTVHLREGLLRDLPPGWVVVLSGRGAPDPAWGQGGWEHVVVDLPLEPLPPEDARRCARAHGVAPDRADPVAAWSQGLPLAIVLGAISGDLWEPGEPLGPGLAETMLRRLWGDGTDDLRVLATAAIARQTTVELLDACLDGGSSPSDAMDWLASLPFTSPLGRGLVLHAAVGDAVRAVVEARHPALAADLRARIAHHAHDEAVAAGASVSLDLALLERDPQIRWGFGWDRYGTYRLGGCRPGDADIVEARLTDADRATWWPAARRCFEEIPQHVWLLRRGDGTVDGFMIVASSADPEPALPDDALLGPWLEHARDRAALGASVIWRNATDLTPDGRARQTIGGGGLLVSGAPNPRFLYLPIDPSHPEAVAFSAALGGVHLPELDVDHGEGPTECHIVDLGPGGMLGSQLDAVLTEAGLPSVAAGTATARPDPAAVRAALSDWDRPDRLARNPIASGRTPAERTASVRTLVAQAVDDAFGTSPSEQQLRAVLVAGLLERHAAHEQVAAELHLSRSTYFRLLRTASGRLEAFLAS